MMCEESLGHGVEGGLVLGPQEAMAFIRVEKIADGDALRLGAATI